MVARGKAVRSAVSSGRHEITKGMRKTRSIGQDIERWWKVNEVQIPGTKDALYRAFLDSLGFTVRDLIARVTGAPLARQFPGYTVRPAAPSDLDTCNQVCWRVHGHDRSGELRDAITRGSATVVEHAGRLSGYATVIGVSGHAVGETTEAVQALIGAASAFERGGFLVPLRNGELFRWCLAAGFRVAVPQTLMSRGFYQEPAGAFLPSILY